MVEADAEQTAIEDSTAVLLCNVTSFPAPSIEWYRVEEDGEAVLLVSQDSPDEDFGVYEILNVTQSHAGLYRCVGQYSHGSNSVDISLVVLSKIWSIATGIQYWLCCADTVSEPVCAVGCLLPSSV